MVAMKTGAWNSSANLEFMSEGSDLPLLRWVCTNVTVPRRQANVMLWRSNVAGRGKPFVADISVVEGGRDQAAISTA
jgi:hypothetical protein